MVSLVRRTERNHSMRNALSCSLQRDTAPHDPRLLELSVEPHVSYLRGVMHQGKKEIVSTAQHSLVRWKNCAPGPSVPACKLMERLHAR
jgi:hypothetical protein